MISAIDTALQQISSAGKYAGVFCMAPDLAQHYIAQGANFLAVGTDTMVLAQGLRELRDRFTGGTGQEPDEPQAGY